MDGARADHASDLEAQVARLVDAVHEKYRADFREYARPFLVRRVQKCMSDEGVTCVAAYASRLLEDDECMERFLKSVTVHVTTMFRDADFYSAFRTHVVPRLQKLPFIRIWHAGCSTGEEAYSLAVLLDEARLLDRSRIYATDVSARVLQHARQGVFPLSAFREFTRNYIRAGGTGSFSNYYTASYDRAIFKRALRERILFSRHSLASDGVFNHFDVVLCRNVLIYFNASLASRAHRVLYESVSPGGVLGLGASETVQFTPYADRYRPFEADIRLFLKAS